MSDATDPGAHSGTQWRRRWRRKTAGPSGRGSPLTRKIIVFNLIGLVVLTLGILALNSSRDSLVRQKANALVSEAELVANVFEAALAVASTQGQDGDATLMTSIRVGDVLDGLSLRNGVEVAVFDLSGDLVGRIRGAHQSDALTAFDASERGETLIGDALAALLEAAARMVGTGSDRVPASVSDQLHRLLPAVWDGGTLVETGVDASGGTAFYAAAPILGRDGPVGALGLSTPAGQIDALVRTERERVLQMFIVAALVSIGLSLVLASTIASPLSDLAAAAEVGRDGDRGGANPARVRIPDLSGRPDEIGRLSRALRGMVSALYHRLDGNEQFAADVAHEIKNPLASVQSAVGTLRLVSRPDQQARLLDVIEHDVRRLDRLVSDISNASRLDAELVREEQKPFDLLDMLNMLGTHLSEQAAKHDIDYITDLPAGPIRLHGLEARLAQVFVNLVTNAISFCEEGDAIRVWARRRENRVLVVVEDTGPGIPEQALTKIFRRFYSERPAEHFGNNSGLGLSISKQIIEAHGGVIWAENIRPTDADPTSDPLGARFVVGLPL